MQHDTIINESSTSITKHSKSSMMASAINPYLTESDLIVLADLFQDIDNHKQCDEQKEDMTTHDAIARLSALNSPESQSFQPTIFVSWDNKDLLPVLNRYIVQPYARIASRIVRHPTDVVFLTHTLTYLFVNLPSAVGLFYRFTILHAVAHAVFTAWCAGSFTLMMHNHIHNGGVLAKSWAWLDVSFPHVVGFLFGHTWNSYYYHHVKHHHVEGNGPADLSSTIRYQRDSAWHFALYAGRFILFIWFELPLYFWRNGKRALAVKALSSEIGSYAFLCLMVRINAPAAILTLVIPLLILRLAMMVGNWGQHALVDEVEPDSDFRSSITLIDVPSNRFCFNDGYHTAHHLNPRRHWREHPVHFLKSKALYSNGRALVFHNIDYNMMTFKLLQKDYMYLAARLVPIGGQIGMSQEEVATLLRSKTRRFTEEDIRTKFKNKQH